MAHNFAGARPEDSNGAVHWTSLFLLSVVLLVTLLLPKVLHSLVVHQLTFLTQRAVRRPPASTDSFCCDLAEPTPQPCFLNVENLAGRHAVGFCAVGPPPSGEPFRAQKCLSANLYGFARPASVASRSHSAYAELLLLRRSFQL